MSKERLGLEKERERLEYGHGDAFLLKGIVIY